MKMELIEFYENFPVNMQSMATSMGTSKQWINSVLKNRTSMRDELKRKHILSIQLHVQQQAVSLKNIKLTASNIDDVLSQSPFSIILLSKRMKQKSNFITQLLETPRYKRDKESIRLVQEEINTLGETLEKIIITDYIEHDEIANALQHHKRFNGVVV
jgi:hypothetical protein